MQSEIALFKELWPVLNMKKTPAETEVSVSLSETILPQMEPDAYADENQILLKI